MRDADLHITFLKAGLNPMIQDLGRWQAGHFHVPMNGCMDMEAAKRANALVGNEEADPVFEFTAIGPRLQFSQPVRIAICGADLSPTINGQNIPNNKLIMLRANDVLAFGKCKSGFRAYLAVGASLQSEPWLGSHSYSPHFEQQSQHAIFKTGDQVYFNYKKLNDSKLIKSKIKPEKFTFVAGPEFDLFESSFIEAFLAAPLTLHGDSNRHAYTFEEDFARFNHPKGIISSFVIPGTIQVTAAGKIILLMRDAQVTGGYARLGVVTEEDLNFLGQCGPRERIRFKKA